MVIATPGVKIIKQPMIVDCKLVIKPNFKEIIAMAVKTMLDNNVLTRLFISNISINQIKKYKINPIPTAIIVSWIPPPKKVVKNPVPNP